MPLQNASLSRSTSKPNDTDLRNFAACALSIGAAAMLLSACSGGSQVSGIPSSPTSPQQQAVALAPVTDLPDSSKGMTYVSVIGGTTVYGYQHANRGNNP